MISCKGTIRRLIAIVCIAVLVLYASFVFIPHTHGPSDTDCAVCALIESSRELLAGVAAAALLCRACSFLLSQACEYFFLPAVRDVTPVGRKVKLSD